MTFADRLRAQQQAATENHTHLIRAEVDLVRQACLEAAAGKHSFCLYTKPLRFKALVIQILRDEDKLHVYDSGEGVRSQLCISWANG